jgi:DNA-binding NtrC family response regulator
LPPLRERPEDIATFARHFMQKAARRFERDPLNLSSALLGALSNYSWPGNLRELESIINRYLILGEERPILDALATDGLGALAVVPPPDRESGVGLQELIRSLKGSAESAAIASALDETNWNRRAAAQKMRMSYTALRYKIKQYDLERRISSLD